VKLERTVVAILASILLLIGGSNVQAWNNAGHIIAVVIAYDDLEKRDPEALRKAIDVLKKHPAYKSMWKTKLSQFPEKDRDKYLMMLAAPWPDTVNEHSSWHYVNIPYYPGKNEVEIPKVDSMLTGFDKSRFTVSNSDKPSERAKSLAWMLHMMGDIHQPMHSVKLVTDQFPEPLGCKGGNLFFIRPADGKKSIKLHSFWDGVIMKSNKLNSIRNEATRLMNEPGMDRDSLAQRLTLTDFNGWAVETYGIAVKDAYLNGSLKGGKDEQSGELLPDAYTANAKKIAEGQIVLAGYRISDVLGEMFGK